MISDLTLANKINIDIFLDGADLEIVKKFSKYDFIKGGAGYVGSLLSKKLEENI